MSGTKAGGIKAAATNKAKYGDDFYKRIGQRGGQSGTTGGFAATVFTPCDCVRCQVLKTGFTKPRCAGFKGGTISRKGKK